MTQIEAYESITKAALNQYDVVPEVIKFLAHSGNTTFYIETGEEKFILRIHKGFLDSQDDIWQRPDVIESELLWLSALGSEENLTVQKPVQNLQGKWVTQVLSDDSENVFYCSLLNWIDGEVSDAHRTPQQAYQLGLLIAKLHHHSSKWKLPPNFIRPIFDKNRLHQAMSAFYPAVSYGLISLDHYNMFAAATQKIEKKMKIMGRGQDVWGLIHADLHEGNYLFYNEEIRPIDFARCGFGYYLYDIAESIQYLLPQVRSSFFDGYQTICQFPEGYLQIVEGFFIMAIIYNYSFHINNPEEHEWIANDSRHVANKHLYKYLEGQSFLLGI
jgi:Ser/Thr protein kinase RdoA (MazF antagonist)